MAIVAAVVAVVTLFVPIGVVVVVGPAVIEELDATTLVHPGYQAAVDQYGNLLVRRQ